MVLKGKDDRKRRGLEGTLCNGLNHLLKDRKSYHKMAQLQIVNTAERDVDGLRRSEAAEAVVGVECMCSLAMLVHFLVNNVKQNPLKVRAQSLRLGRARMFTGAEL